MERKHRPGRFEVRFRFLVESRNNFGGFFCLQGPRGFIRCIEGFKLGLKKTQGERKGISNIQPFFQNKGMNKNSCEFPSGDIRRIMKMVDFLSPPKKIEIFFSDHTKRSSM